MKDSIEFRSGVEWNILYGEDVYDPAAGRIIDIEGKERVSILPDQSGDGFNLTIDDDYFGFYEVFDEAMDIANEHIHALPPWDQEGYIIREQTGKEGIYLLGSLDGKEYVANAFWSAEEPGYVNHGVFAIGGEQMEILTSGFYNGYLTIEDCVRDLASDFTPLEKPDIQFVAFCSQEFDTVSDYRDALEEGALGKSIPVPSWDQVIAENQSARSTSQHEKLLAGIMDKAVDVGLGRHDAKETFYFSFGTSLTFPFKLGWVEVQAKDRMEACEIFSSHYPKRDGLINCAFIYSEKEWKQTGMSKGCSEQICHRVITDWGPFAENNCLDDLVKEAKEKAAEKNSGRQELPRLRTDRGVDR